MTAAYVRAYELGNEQGVSENMSNKTKKAKRTRTKAKKAAPQKKHGPTGAADFIRQQPPDMRAKDVVLAAKRRGINVAMSYVYNVRLAARKRTGGVKKRTVGSPGVASNSEFKRRASELADKFINDLTECLMQSIRGT